MKCPECGTEIDDELLEQITFCPSCGAKLQNAVPLDLSNVNIDGILNKNDNPGSNNHKKTKVKVIILVTLVCIVLIGAAIFFYGRSKDIWNAERQLVDVEENSESYSAEIVDIIEEANETVVETETESIVETEAETETEDVVQTSEEHSETEAAVETEAEPFEPGENDIRLVQQLLLESGYRSMVIDGSNGPITRWAISDFRDRANLPPGDYIDQELINILSAYVASLQETEAETETETDIVVSDNLINEDVWRFGSLEEELSQTYTLHVGERVRPDVSLWYRNVNIADSNIISVDSEGIITALKSGRTTAVYHGEGTMQYTYTIIVE